MTYNSKTRSKTGLSDTNKTLNNLVPKRQKPIIIGETKVSQKAWSLAVHIRNELNKMAGC